MTMHESQILFVLVSIAQIVVGFYCAHKLGPDYPLWVRLVVLAPCLSAVFALWCMVLGIFVAYPPDIIDAFATMLLYALVASRFSSRPWLDIRSNK